MDEDEHAYLCRAFLRPVSQKGLRRTRISNLTAPLLPFHEHVGGINGDIQWPVGGADELAKSIEWRYVALGGKVHYRSRVEKILVENDKAVGSGSLTGASTEQTSLSRTPTAQDDLEHARWQVHERDRARVLRSDADETPSPWMFSSESTGTCRRAFVIGVAA